MRSVCMRFSQVSDLFLWSDFLSAARSLVLIPTSPRHAAEIQIVAESGAIAWGVYAAFVSKTKTADKASVASPMCAWMRRQPNHRANRRQPNHRANRRRPNHRANRRYPKKRYPQKMADLSKTPPNPRNPTNPKALRVSPIRTIPRRVARPPKANSSGNPTSCLAHVAPKSAYRSIPQERIL